MKRFLSLFTMLCMLFACISFPAIAQAEAEEVSAAPVYGEEAFQLLSSLGIMIGDENGNANLGEYMTRAEFAQLLQNILTYGEEEESDAASVNGSSAFFGDDSVFSQVAESTEPVVEVQRFTDVFDTHWAYDAILFADANGLMTGTSATTFDPDRQIKRDEVTKVFMTMLGYADLAQADGGYPTGYQKYAQRLKLFKKVSTSDVYITRGGIAQMLVNCFDVEMLQVAGVDTGVIYEFDEGETFATEILGLSKITGLMTDNGYTSIIGESTYEGKNIVVNNVLLRVDDGVEFADFIGRDVSCYYKNSNTDDLGAAVHVVLSEKDTVTAIDGGGVDSLSTTKTVYYSTGGSMKKIDVSGAYVIYNGAAITEYDDSIYDIDFGSVEVIETRSSQYKKIVKIKSFESWYVGGVNVSETIIYNKLREGDYASEEDILDIETEEDGYLLKVYFADGSPASFSDIAAGSIIDVLRNDTGRVTEIYVSKTVITDFTISSIAEDDGKLIYSDGVAEYTLARSYMNYSDRTEFRLNDVVTLYLNTNSQIVWSVKSESADTMIGYMIRSGKEKDGAGLSSAVAAKMYDPTNDSIEVFNYADKITLSTSEAEIKKLEEKEFLNSAYVSYEGICKYGLNDEDEINYVEYPIINPDKVVDGKLHLLYHVPAKGETADSKIDSSLVGTGLFQGNILDSRVLVSSTAKVINYNTSDDVVEDDKFVISAGTASFPTNDGAKYTYSYGAIWLYTDVKDSVTAKYGFYHNTVALSDFNPGDDFPPIYIAKKVYGGRYPNDDTGYIIETAYADMNTFAEETLYMADEEVFDSIVTHNQVDTVLQPYVVKDANGDYVPGKLEPGDMFCVEKDGNGFVKRIIMLWDESAPRDSWDPNADGTSTTPGGFAGMLPYYVYTGEDNVNPFGYTSSGILANATNSDITGKPFIFRACYYRMYNGFVLRMPQGGGMVLTTYDVVANGKYENVDETKYARDTWSPTRLITIDLTEEGTVKVTKGATADLRSFENYGTDCSRVVVGTRLATINNTFVINGYYKK